MWHTLREQYRVVCLDMLGFGFSDKPNARNYSIHQQADIVEAVVEHVELDAFHVLAHDYGDTVAQELLARQNAGQGRGRWLSGCFLNGGLFPETHRALLTQKLLLSPLGPLLNRLAGKAQFDRSFRKVFGAGTRPTEEQLEQFCFLINLKGGRHIFHNLITYMSDRLEHRERWVNALIVSQVPLALINGSADPVSGAHMVARYQELGCRLDYLAELENIGHYPQVEASSLVAHHYLDFLQGAHGHL
jgi:pimeloyl-ACP methyl ester carboxylesterase